jgi:hypothetical protein
MRRLVLAHLVLPILALLAWGAFTARPWLAIHRRSLAYHTAECGFAADRELGEAAWARRAGYRHSSRIRSVLAGNPRHLVVRDDQGGDHVPFGRRVAAWLLQATAPSALPPVDWGSVFAAEHMPLAPTELSRPLSMAEAFAYRAYSRVLFSPDLHWAVMQRWDCSAEPRGWQADTFTRLYRSRGGHWEQAGTVASVLRSTISPFPIRCPGPFSAG